MCQKRIFVTIDTEPDCDTNWNRIYPREYSNIREGIPKYLRPIWKKHNICPIYLLSPEIFWDSPSIDVLKSELKKGARVGSHLHSEYIGPNIKPPNKIGRSSEYPCYAHANNIEYQKLMNLTNMISDVFGVTPLWYRAARYGADLCTVRALEKLGYLYDTSVTPGINWKNKGGPDFTDFPNQPYYISDKKFSKRKKNKKGIKEYPISIIGKRFGQLGKLFPNKWYLYRWLRPSVSTYYEMRTIIEDFEAFFKAPELVMMFHSNECVPGKSPYTRNELMHKLFLKRLDNILSLLKKKGYS